MQFKKALEFVLFVFGTALTCFVILTSSNLQAQAAAQVKTLITEQLGLNLTPAVHTESPTTEVCNEPEISAHQGLVVLEAMLEHYQAPQDLCFEDPNANSCVAPADEPVQLDQALLLLADNRA